LCKKHNSWVDKVVGDIISCLWSKPIFRLRAEKLSYETCTTDMHDTKLVGSFLTAIFPSKLSASDHVHVHVGDGDVEGVLVGVVIVVVIIVVVVIVVVVVGRVDNVDYCLKKSNLR